MKFNKPISHVDTYCMNRIDYLSTYYVLQPEGGAEDQI